MFKAVFTVLCAAFLAESLQLRERIAEPRVIQFDLARRDIKNPVEHDRQRHRKRDDTVNARLDNQQTFYALNISLGSPAQHFTVTVDTGSSDLWVNSADSDICRHRSNPCETSGVYNANRSSTYNYVNSLFNISYVDGSGAAGDYVTDTLRFSGETVEDFQFGVGYDSSSAQGILGLGYPENEAGLAEQGAEQYENLPARLASDGTIASSAYSLWLNDLDASTGSLLFGGVDRSQYEGELITLPIQRSRRGAAPTAFYITLNSIDLQDSTLGRDLALAVLLDSGTSLTYLPNSMVTDIYESVDARYDEESGSALVPCSLARSDANMTFHFDAPASISVPMNELVFDTIDSSGGQLLDEVEPACLFGISPSEDGSGVLGDTFLRSAYVVFDLENNEISMAQSRLNATGSDIVEIGSGDDAVPSATDASDETDASHGLPGQPTSTSTGESDDDDGGVGTTKPSVVAALLAVGFGVILV